MRAANSIVVAQLSFIGDMVFTTPLLSGLTELWPHARIVVIGKPSAIQLLDGFPGISETIAYDKHGKENNPGSMLALGRRVRALAPDIFFGVTRSARTALLARLSDAPVRVGFRGFLRGLAYTRTAKRDDQAASLPERPLALPRLLGYEVPDRPLTLIVSTERQQRAADALRQAGWREAPILAIAPGANYATKRWPEQHVARLLDLVSETRNWQPALYGGPEESAIIGRLLEGRSGILDRRGTTVKTMRDELSLASGFLSGDSGPAHIARALGTPTVALFGPTDPAMVRNPASVREVTLGLDCSPCSAYGDNVCPLGHHRCLEDLTPETVLGVLDQTLRS